MGDKIATRFLRVRPDTPATSSELRVGVQASLAAIGQSFRDHRNVGFLLIDLRGLTKEVEAYQKQIEERNKWTRTHRV